VENAVAPLGTALTEEQAVLLARYAQRVILLYDSDKAGLRATFRAGDELLRAGVEVLVATLPEGEDPDSLVRRSGAAALNRYLDDAVDVLERKLNFMERRGMFGSIAGVRRAIDKLLPTVRATTDEVLRGVYLARLAEKTGVPRETLEREAAVDPDRPARASAAPPRGGPREHDRAAGHQAPGMPSSLGPERALLLLLLRDESWVERAASQLSPNDFHDPTYRAIYEGLLHSEGARDLEGQWLEIFPARVRPTVEEIRGDPEAEHLNAPEQMFDASVRRLLARPFEERLRQLEREMHSAEPERQSQLLQERAQVSQTMRERNLLHRWGTLRSPAP
jgi:DNA primase